MAQARLGTPFVDNGVRYVNFFNGRQLSAEDLEHERDAIRQHQEQLGRGVGSGVIDGLQVTATVTGKGPALHVVKGLAVNRQGQVLSVPDDVDIELGTPVVPGPTARRDEAGLFGDCRPAAPLVSVNGTGLYVLLVGPSSALRERTPKVGLRDAGVAARCDFAWAVEGVQFTLQPLEPRGMDTVGAATREKMQRLMDAAGTENLSLLRDYAAHAFLGTEPLAAHYADLLRREPQESPVTEYGERDALWRDFPSLVCDVPLAVVFWTGPTVHFVDGWSVRRRLAPPPLTRTWPVPTSERRVSEAEATFFHFQEQLAWMLSQVGGKLEAIEARRSFRYLPPAGVLPLGSVSASADLTRLPFFAGRTARRPVFIPAAAVEPLLRQSLAYPPIDLDARDDRGRVRAELVWLYQVRETARATSSVERHLLFATGHMPYHGHARFDVSWFDYSNYSSVRLGSPGV